MKKTISIPKLKRFFVPRVQRDEIPFFISYLLFLLYSIFSSSFFLKYINNLWKPVFVLCFALLFISEIIKNGLTNKSIFEIIVILLFSINITRVGKGMGQNAIAAVMIFLFCVRNISFKKICWYTLFVSSIALIIVVGSSFAGIIPNYVSDGARHREYLGFRYALNGPALFSNMTLVYIYLKKEKISFAEVVFFMLMNLFFYIRTDSRLSFYFSILSLFVAYYLKNNSQEILGRKLLCYLMVFSFIIGASVSLLLTVKYNPSVKWMATINKIFESRLSLAQNSLQQYGVKLFGLKDLQWIGNGLNMYGEKSNEQYLYVDSYYIQLLQRFGLIFFLVVIIFLTVTTFKCYKNRDIFLLVIFTIIAMHNMLDDSRMALQYNTFWFAAGSLVFSPFQNHSIRRENESLLLLKFFMRS